MCVCVCVVGGNRMLLACQQEQTAHCSTSGCRSLCVRARVFVRAVMKV